MANVSKRVLIVEDQASDLVGPSALISNLGYSVTYAFDGEQGLSAAMFSKFDLIILDWNLPLISGAEILKTLAQTYSLLGGKVARVIVHSGQQVDLSEFEGIDGIEILDVWQKPTSPIAMSKKLKSFAETRRI